MKKTFLILSLVAAVITACQQTPKTVPVDTEAEKADIDSLFDKFYEAFIARDVETLASYLTEDALCMGTDPSEFWTKPQMKDMWTQMLADSAPEIKYYSERVIKVSADGHSATVVDQYMMPGYSTIPWRNAYHLTKTDGKWMILVLNSSFIPKNEDIPKLNGALE